MMKRVLIALAVGVLLAAGIKVGYEIYMNSREYTIDDINGVWTAEMESGYHCVMYIHDGRIDYMRYEYQDERDGRGFDKYRALIMQTVPEGSFNTFSWKASFDLERTGSQNSTYGIESYDEYEFEFRRGKIYQGGFLLGGELAFSRAKEEEHPHIMDLSRTLDQNYQLAQSKQPLEVVEMHVFDQALTTDNGIFLYAGITNPNPYRIDTVYATLRWEGYSGEVRVPLQSIAANSTGTYVALVSCSIAFGPEGVTDPAECSLEYNIYEISAKYGDHPIVEVTDSRVIRDEKTGKVKGLEADTRVLDLTDKSDYYELYALFYKQGGIAGVARGVGYLEDIDQPDSMEFVSDIGEYDNFEIIVVNHYKLPIRRR